ncbi:MAG: hypothetical protein WC343_00735 [Bacilli bacterium]
MATVSIVLKAIDEYSKTVTGLNQGFELAGKTLGILEGIANTAFAAVKAGAEFAFDGVKKAIDLAALGGAFDEQRNQFENLAKSYNVSGQAIIDTVKATSSNTLSEFDSIAVGTRALAAGLKGEALETALSYIKRWTEATGQSFDQVAETVFSALTSGRFAVLKQMGLVIEKGATVEEVVDKMAAGLKRFGATGFNTADELDSLTAAQDDLARKIGQAINQSSIFQNVLGTVSKAVNDFVKEFDAKPIKVLSDALSQGFLDAKDAAAEYFPSIANLFSITKKDIVGAAAALSLEVTDIFFALAKSSANAFNLVLDSLKLAETTVSLSKGINLVVDLVTGASVLVVEIVGRTLATITFAAEKAVSAFASILEAAPNVADSLGLNAKDFRDVEGGLKRLANDVDAGTSSMTKGILAIGNMTRSAVESILRNTDSWKIGLDDVDSAHQRLNETIRAVGEAAKDSYGQITAADLAQADAFNNPENDALTTLEGIMSDLEAFDQETTASLQGISQKKALESASQGSNVMQDTARLLSGANWPAEFSALGEFLFKWVLSSATGSPVPMAITTGI